MKRSVIGDSPRRREDQRFVTGAGAYIDDLKFDDLARAAFVRSPHAHARIRAIRTTRALKVRGVVAIYTADDVKGIGPLPPGRPVHYALADGEDAAVAASATLPASARAKYLIPLMRSPLLRSYCIAALALACACVVWLSSRVACCRPAMAS